MSGTYRHLGNKRVYLPLYKMAGTPFHIQGDDMYNTWQDDIIHYGIESRFLTDVRPE